MSQQVKAVLTYHALLIVLMGVLSAGFYVLPFHEGQILARIVFGFSIVVIAVMAIVEVNKAASAKDGEA